MHAINHISAQKALEWLLEGNRDYINSKNNHQGDISLEKRIHTHRHGQSPFAIVVTCSDSRVIPESIFMKGIGDLFVIRLAGNVIGDFALGSIEYAVQHLGCKLIMVMGHTSCGAISASLDGTHDGYVGMITDEIKKAIGHIRNPLAATKINVGYSVSKIRSSQIIKDLSHDGLVVLGSIYHTSTGRVELIDYKVK